MFRTPSGCFSGFPWLNFSTAVCTVTLKRGSVNPLTFYISEFVSDKNRSVAATARKSPSSVRQSRGLREARSGWSAPPPPASLRRRSAGQRPDAPPLSQAGGWKATVERGTPSPRPARRAVWPLPAARPLSAHASGSVGDKRIWSLALEAEGPMVAPSRGFQRPAEWDGQAAAGRQEMTPAVGLRCRCVARRPLPRRPAGICSHGPVFCRVDAGTVSQPHGAGRDGGRCSWGTGQGADLDVLQMGQREVFERSCRPCHSPPVWTVSRGRGPRPGPWGREGSPTQLRFRPLPLTALTLS